MRTEQFMERVQPDPNTGCWLWGGAGHSKGYGTLSVDGRRAYAHRESHRLFVGPIPDGRMVLHHCDVRCCVNPDHIYLGTAQQNTDDMWDRGRAGCNKLTAKQVARIRSAYPDLTQDELASRYGVTQSAISLIVRGEAWPEVAPSVAEDVADRFGPGVEVEWTSTSQGIETTYHGTVLGFLPVGRSVTEYADGYSKNRIRVKPSTYVSSVMRYAVRVERGPRKLPWLYAPRATTVRRSGTDRRSS